MLLDDFVTFITYKRYSKDMQKMFLILLWKDVVRLVNNLPSNLSRETSFGFYNVQLATRGFQFFLLEKPNIRLKDVLCFFGVYSFIFLFLKKKPFFPFITLSLMIIENLLFFINLIFIYSSKVKTFLKLCK